MVTVVNVVINHTFRKLKVNLRINIILQAEKEKNIRSSADRIMAGKRKKRQKMAAAAKKQKLERQPEENEAECDDTKKAEEDDPEPLDLDRYKSLDNFVPLYQGWAGSDFSSQMPDIRPDFPTCLA